jgi:hypothetical protein
MKKAMIVAAALFMWINAAAQQFDVDTIVFNGNPDKHINLVILGDGYTIGELTKFITNATTFTNGFFNEIPFVNYRKYFNVFIIKVPSNESGASHPGTAADEPGGQPVISVDNYFGSTFDFAGIHRLLVATKNTAISSVLASNFPAYDQVLILVNSPYYGGSGGYYTVASTHSSSAQIAIHELGHSFTGLKDEYWAGDNYAAEGLNMTKQSNPALVRWKNWIGTYGIGVYQHSGSAIALQWYRPHQNCMMRYLGVPFCSVCIQGTIEKIHSITTPVESYIPLENNITAPVYPLKFKVSLIDPSPNTLKRNWMLNGSQYRHNIDSVMIDGSNLPSRINTLTAIIEDTTGMLKVDAHASIHLATVSWTIDKGVTGIKEIRSSVSDITIDLYPNPASQYINVRLSGEIKGRIKIEIYDMHGKRLKISSLHSDQINTINLNDLEGGVYLVKIFADNNLVSSRKMIRK